MKAACHCGAVRFEIDETPAWVLDCNCTVCRRYGGLWSYYHQPARRKLLVSKPDPDTTDTYVWGDKELAFHRCKTCGCLTHFEAIQEKVIMGVNARMMVTLDPSTVRVIQKDNGHTGWFWTRSDEPPQPSQHPFMPIPGPDDWR